MEHKKHHEQDFDLNGTSMVSIDTCGFDGPELLTLELFRYFCLSYADPFTQAWQSAFRRSKEEVGRVNGPLLAFSVSELLSAIRHERINQFNFVDPRCEVCSKRIYATELAVMMLIRSTHLEDTRSLSEAAFQIVEGEQSTNTIEASYALSACLICIKMTKKFGSQTSTTPSKYFH